MFSGTCLGTSSGSDFAETGTNPTSAKVTLSLAPELDLLASCGYQVLAVPTHFYRQEPHNKEATRPSHISGGAAIPSSSSVASSVSRTRSTSSSRASRNPGPARMTCVSGLPLSSLWL